MERRGGDYLFEIAATDFMEGQRSIGESLDEFENVCAIGRNLSQIARRISEGQGVDPGLRVELAVVLPAVEELRQALREVVKVNRISWESSDVEAS